MVALTTPQSSQSSLLRKQMIGHGMTRCHFLVGDMGLQGVLGGVGRWALIWQLMAEHKLISIHDESRAIRARCFERWESSAEYCKCISYCAKGGKKHVTVINKSKTWFLATKGLDAELKISKVILYDHLDEWLLFNLNLFEKAVAEVKRCPVRLQCGAPCWARLKKQTTRFHPLGDLSRLRAHFFFKTWMIFF